MGDHGSGSVPNRPSLASASAPFWTRLIILAAAFLLLGAIASNRAVALSIEPTGHFGGILAPTPPPGKPSEFPEEVQLGGVGGMAVNISGVGGVEPGTVYAATRGTAGEETVRIARYEPAGDTLVFVGAWEMTPSGEPTERCGQALGLPKCPPRPASLSGKVDVEVDQATGNVYFFSTENLAAGNPTVTVFNADGSELITRFGVLAPGGVSTASSPDKLHNSPAPGGLAVDSAGTVYLFDVNTFDNFYHRLMVFKPVTPGNFKTYAYVEGGDLAAGFIGKGEFPSMPVTDSEGNVYVAGFEGTYIQKYKPVQPASPVCEFKFQQGGIASMTVNPETGEVFFYSYKDKKVHKLSPCNEAGDFTELQSIAVDPKRDDLYALVYDSDRQLEPKTRPIGVLYGGAPGPVPSIGGKGEPGMGALGYIFAPAVEADPVVESETVSAVKPTSAVLEAEINPRGSLTRYRFQFITEASYLADGESFGEGTLDVPEVPSPLGAGQEPLQAAAVLTGLVPDTDYRYRAIAQSNCSSGEPERVCEDVGATESFHSYPVEVVGPPDSRAYELVSPPEKSGGQVLPAEPLTASCGPDCKPGRAYNHFPMQSASSGDAVVYEGTPFSAEGGGVIENEYISRRTPSGWGTVNLTPPLLQSKGGQGYKAFDADLDEGILEQISPALRPEAPADYDNLYLQSTANPLGLNPLLFAAPPSRSSGNGSEHFQITYATASADFTHQIFEANDALTAATAFAPEALDGGAKENNLYEWADGDLRLINVMPGNAVTIPGAAIGSGTLLKSGNPNSPAAVIDHAISADGSRVFWTSNAGQLYVREDGETSVEIEDPGPGKFLVAAADGSKVLLSDGCLYDLAGKVCDDLTGGKGGFLGIAGRSEDLSRVYFVDTAVLSEAENSEGDKAQAGKPNLYAWVEGATQFIATLLVSDNEAQSGSGDWQASTAVRSAEASPAGRYLTFVSTAPLVKGFDNAGPCQLIGETGEYATAPCPEVFLYDSVTGVLACPSCNPSGAAPLGGGTLRLIKGAQGYLAQPRYLTDSGRLFFDSRDSLTYLDTNAGVEDVYQYEPQGLGGCQREGGCVSLISAGRGPVDSNFLTMDSSGDNVFFTARDRLVPADKDELIDLYDARVDGGFTEPQRPTICVGETCQPPTSVPVEPSGVSLGGNFKPPKCPKGKVRRGGRCVKKPPHKRKKARVRPRARRGDIPGDSP